MSNLHSLYKYPHIDRKNSLMAGIDSHYNIKDTSNHYIDFLKTQSNFYNSNDKENIEDIINPENNWFHMMYT